MRIKEYLVIPWYQKQNVTVTKTMIESLVSKVRNNVLKIKKKKQNVK